MTSGQEMEQVYSYSPSPHRAFSTLSTVTCSSEYVVQSSSRVVHQEWLTPTGSGGQLWWSVTAWHQLCITHQCTGSRSKDWYRCSTTVVRPWWPRGQIFWLYKQVIDVPWPWDFWPWSWGFWPCVSSLGLVQRIRLELSAMRLRF